MLRKFFILAALALCLALFFCIILAVLLRPSDRMLVSGVAITIVSSLAAVFALYALSTLIGKPHFLPPVIVSSLLTVILWAFFIYYAWAQPSARGFPSYQFGFALAETAVAAAVTLLPAAAALFLGIFPRFRVASIVYVVLCASALTFLVMDIWARDTPSYYQLYIYPWPDTDCEHSANAILSIGAVICLSLIGKLNDRHYFRWVGVVAGAATLALQLTFIWNDALWTHGTATWRVTLITFAPACASAHALLTLLLPLPTSMQAPRLATVLTGIFAAVAAIAFAATYVESSALFDYLARLTVAATLAAVAGFLALAGAAMLKPRTAQPQPLPFTAIDVTCPVCGQRASTPLGNSACRACGLRLSITATEPRCPHCHYLLINRDKSANRCPECGHDV